MAFFALGLQVLASKESPLPFGEYQVTFFILYVIIFS